MKCPICKEELIIHQDGICPLKYECTRCNILYKGVTKSTLFGNRFGLKLSIEMFNGSTHSFVIPFICTDDRSAAPYIDSYNENNRKIFDAMNQGKILKLSSDYQETLIINAAQINTFKSDFIIGR